MNAKLRVLLRVIERRVSSGGTLEDVISDYPLLTEDEKNIILQEVIPNEN